MTTTNGNHTIERIWLTRKEAAEYLGVSVKVLRTSLAGKFAISRIGSSVWYNKENIDKVLLKSKVV